LRSGFGDAFVDYFLAIKQDEIARAGTENGSDPAAVTDWEQKEYFDLA
jgi:glutamine synthetase